MKRAFIAILWLSVTFVAGFTGYRGQQLWEHNRCQLTNANSGDSELNSGSGPESVMQVRAFVAKQETNSNFNDRWLPLQVLHASTHSEHPNFMGPEIQRTHNPAPAREASPSEPAYLLTGAGALGLLLFSAAIHPRRFTVLCIGR